MEFIHFNLFWYTFFIYINKYIPIFLSIFRCGTFTEENDGSYKNGYIEGGKKKRRSFLCNVFPRSLFSFL